LLCEVNGRAMASQVYARARENNSELQKGDVTIPASLAFSGILAQLQVPGRTPYGTI
jgi:hypothetical protein